MPISSSRQRLMRQTPGKPTTQSQPNVTINRDKKHRKQSDHESDENNISLPRISQLQITEQDKELTLQQQRTFSSPYGQNIDCTTTKKKKHGGHSRLKDIAFKKIRVFNRMPDPEPLTLVFTTQDETITHHDVLQGLRRVRDVSIYDVASIQFVDMNVVIGSAGVPARWLIRVKGHTACRVLLEYGLTIKEDRVFLRRLDDVNAEDYNAYMKRKALLSSDEHSAIQELLSTNTGPN